MSEGRIKSRFRQKLGYEPDFSNPRSFQEKMCWKMLYDRNPLLTLTADKYLVYDYVKGKGLEDILIPLLHVSKKASEIPFHKLPDNYVVKGNGGSGRMYIVVKDKMKKKYGSFSPLHIPTIISNIDAYSGAVYNYGIEWCYNDIKPMVIAQDFIGGEDLSLQAIKFFVFNGKCDYLYVEVSNGKTHYISMLDREWKDAGVSYDKYPPLPSFQKPDRADEMLAIAEKLGEDFDFVRVDLCWDGNNIYFGELTHYPTAGITKFAPKEFSYEIGKDWKPNE